MQNIPPIYGLTPNLQLGSLVAGSTRCYHGSIGDTRATFLYHPCHTQRTGFLSRKLAVVNKLCQDLHYGRKLQERPAPGMAGAISAYMVDATTTGNTFDLEGYMVQYPACATTLEAGFDPAMTAQLEDFCVDLVSSTRSTRINPRHCDAKRTLITSTGKIMLIDFSDAILMDPVTHQSEGGHQYACARMVQPDGDKAPEQEHGVQESMKTFIFQNCYMQARLMSHKVVDSEFLWHYWEQGVDVELGHVVPDTAICHRLKLGLRRDPRARLQPETYLGHFSRLCAADDEKIAATAVFEMVQQMSVFMEGMPDLEHKAHELLPDGLQAIFPEIITAMPRDNAANQHFNDVSSFLRGLSRLTANIADTWPHLELVLEAYLPPIPADDDVDDETSVNENRQVALYRYLTAGNERIRCFLMINQAALDCGHHRASNAFWRTSTQIVAPNDPQPPLDAGQPDLLETRLLKVTDLIQLIKSRLAVIGLEELITGGDLRRRGLSAAEQAELDAVLQYLTEAVGDSTLIDLPSPLDRSLKAFVQNLTRSAVILVKRDSSLSDKTLSFECVYDRLQSLAINHVVIDSTSPDSLAICAEYSTIALAKALNRVISRHDFCTMMFGIMHVASVFSRAPAGSQVLTGIESDVDVDMKAFILSNLMMYYIVCGQYNAAAALQTRDFDEEGLFPLETLAVALKAGDYVTAIYIALHSTNPVLCLYLNLVDLRNWRLRAAQQLASLQGVDGQLQMPLLEAAKQLGLAWAGDPDLMPIKSLPAKVRLPSNQVVRVALGGMGSIGQVEVEVTRFIMIHCRDIARLEEIARNPGEPPQLMVVFGAPQVPQHEEEAPDVQQLPAVASENESSDGSIFGLDTE